MEPPSKKRRITGSSYTGIGLHARRAQNDFRLKSIFESIFEKYGRDFDGIGDEIDMETGEIVVDNGHIQGMTNERDPGDAEYSSEKLGDSDEQDNPSSIEDSEEHSAALDETGDSAVLEDSDASEQSDIDNDNLMDGIPIDSHLHQFGNKARRAVSIPPDDEEDELASSDVEKLSHNKGRSRAQDRCSLFKDETIFRDEPAVEPIWRAPPLPDVTRLKKKGEEVSLTSIDNTREYSDDERAGVSLWTPEVKRSPRRRHTNARSKNRRSMPFTRGQVNNRDGLLQNFSRSEPTSRRAGKWSQKEEDLLTHLKTTTNLSAAGMESYFPERQSTAIGSHWTYMITRGKASPSSQIPTVLGRRMSFPSSSTSTSQHTYDNRSEPHDHGAIFKAEKPRTVQQQIKSDLSDEESFVRSPSKPIDQLGDHSTGSRHQVGVDYGTPNGYTMNNPILIPDDDGDDVAVEASSRYSVSEACSSATDWGGKIADSTCQDNSNEIRADEDQAHSASAPLEIENDVLIRRKKLASKFQDQGLEALSMNGRGVCLSSPNTFIRAEPDSKGTEPYNDGTFSYLTRSRVTTAMEASNLLKKFQKNPCEKQREKSIPTKAGEINQTESSTAEGLQKIQSTSSDSTAAAQPLNHGRSGASHEPMFEIASEIPVKRQNVSVVIKLAAKSNPRRKHRDTRSMPLSHHQIRSPLTTTKDEDPTFIRQLSADEESAPAVVGLSMPHQQSLAARISTRSPSVAAPESQYAASAASVLNHARSSLGPEIADSQPLSTSPSVTTPAPEFGGTATSPIILDVDSYITPDAASSARKQVKEATKTIMSESDPLPLYVITGIATPARQRIEEAKESDVVESGSHPSKTLWATRSWSKRSKKEAIAKSSSSIWTAIDDCSEDELSYL